MKITYVTMQWPSRSETFCARDIKALRDMGHDINVISLRPAPPYADRLLKNWGVDKIRRASNSLGSYLSGIVYAFKRPLVFIDILNRCRAERFPEALKLMLMVPIFFWALHQIEKDKPEIVHLFWGHYPAGLGYLLLKSRAAIRLTMFLGAYDLIKKLSLSRVVAHEAHALMTHAHANKPILQSYGINLSRLNVIHRGIDIADIDQHDKKQKRDVHRMIIVSRLIRDKGTHLIIEALPLILARFQDVTLDIVGDGPESEALKRQVSSLGLTKQVTFSGFLTPAEVYDHLYQSSIFVLPSSASGERLPNAVKEAMYAGLTPVVSRTPGIEELVSAESGYIMDSFDVPSIADSICQALANPKTGGQAIIREYFDSRKNMEAYVKIWDEN